MKRPSIYRTTCDLGAHIAFIWRSKTGREMEPDAIQATLREIALALRQHEIAVRRRMLRRWHRPSNN